ncbi:MAG TPA: hypothetical protein VIJ75_20600 [Hanamia sp.]
MKYLLIPFLIFIAGCGSGNTNVTPNTDTGSSQNADSVGVGQFNADTGKIASASASGDASEKSGTNVLFVGEFAIWHDAGDNFNGLYDSTQSLFSLCSTNKVEHVVASQISYAQYASCDTTNSKRVMLLMKDSNGRLNPNGVSLNIVGDHARVIGDPSRIIKLSPAAVDRINATKVTRWPPADGKSTPSLLVPQPSLKNNQKLIDSAKLMQLNRPKQQIVDTQKINVAVPKNHVFQKAETKNKVQE